MKTTVSATSRAKPISWVTMIRVVPVAARSWITVEHLADQLGVERRGRLVEQHAPPGSQGQRAGDGDALLLPAGQLPRVGVGLVGQPDPVEQLARPRLDLACAAAGAPRPAPR